MLRRRIAVPGWSRSCSPRCAEPFSVSGQPVQAPPETQPACPGPRRTGEPRRLRVSSRASPTGDLTGSRPQRQASRHSYRHALLAITQPCRKDTFLLSGWRIPERLKRRGLSAFEAARVAYEAPLSLASFWLRPAIAALLNDPAAPRARETGGKTISSAKTRTTFSQQDKGPTADGQASSDHAACRHRSQTGPGEGRRTARSHSSIDDGEPAA